MHGKGGSFDFVAPPGEPPVQKSAFGLPLDRRGCARTHYGVQPFFYVLFPPSIPGNLNGDPIKFGLFLPQ